MFRYTSLLSYHLVIVIAAHFTNLITCTTLFTMILTGEANTACWISTTEEKGKRAWRASTSCPPAWLLSMAVHHKTAFHQLPFTCLPKAVFPWGFRVRLWFTTILVLTVKFGNSALSGELAVRIPVAARAEIINSHPKKREGVHSHAWENFAQNTLPFLLFPPPSRP